MNVADYLAFRELLETRFGLHVGEDQAEALRSAVLARAAALHLATPEHYRRYLECADEGQEVRRLASLLANGETHFMRVPEHFAVLREHIIPSFLAAGRRSIRIWSAGCATGEEAYSLAMTVREAAREHGAIRADILGSDLCERSLQVARQGVYGPRSLRGLNADLLARYFTAEPEGQRVRPELAGMVRFGYLNLMDHPLPFPETLRWDVIFCRNVLLYFRDTQARRVAGELERTMADDGYLFFAPSESMRNLETGLTMEQLGGVLVHRKGAVTALLAGLRARGWGRPRGRPARPAALPAQPAPVPPAPDWDEDYAAAAGALHAGRLSPELVSEIERLAGRYPERAEAALLLARAYLGLGQADRAQKVAEVLVEGHPLLPAAHFLLGLALSRQGMVRAAIERLSRALYLDRGFFPAHYHLARCYRACGEYRRARVAYRNALAALERVPMEHWHDFGEGYSIQEWQHACRQSLQAVESTLTRLVAGLPG